MGNEEQGSVSGRGRFGDEGRRVAKGESSAMDYAMGKVIEDGGLNQCQNGCRGCRGCRGCCHLTCTRR